MSAELEALRAVNELLRAENNKLVADIRALDAELFQLRTQQQEGEKEVALPKIIYRSFVADLIGTKIPTPGMMKIGNVVVRPWSDKRSVGTMVIVAEGMTAHFEWEGQTMSHVGYIEYVHVGGQRPSVTVKSHPPAGVGQVVKAPF